MKKICKLFCFVLPLLFLLCWTGCMPPDSSGDSDSPDVQTQTPGNQDIKPVNTSIKAMSYNIDTAGGGAKTQNDMVIERIIEELPDLLGVQEETAAWHNVLKNGLEIEGYEHICRFRGGPAGYDEACGIFYRIDRFNLKNSGTFWLSDTPDTPSTASSWGALYPRVCTWTLLTDKKADKDIAFFNTHFDYASENARKKSTQLILGKMEELGVPAFFSGDLNFASDREPDTYGVLTAVMDDARVIAGETMSGCTFHEYGKKPGDLDSGGVNTIASVPIDYIFSTKNDFTVTKFAILKEDGPVYSSDHYAITATLDYAPRT